MLKGRQWWLNLLLVNELYCDGPLRKKGRERKRGGVGVGGVLPSVLYRAFIHGKIV